MSNKDWLCIKFNISKTDGGSYKLDPESYLFGQYYPDQEIFCTLDDEVISCVTTFDGSNLNKKYFGFPTKISSLAEHSSRIYDSVSVDVGIFIDYFNLVLEYNHFCSNNEGRGKMVFYSLKDNFSAPVFFELDKEFLYNTDIETEIIDEPKQYNRSQIISMMKERIISQDKQVEKFVTTILCNQKYSSYKELKQNIMIVGSTGTGKTEMCMSLANLLSVPMIKVDATKYTSSGYKGKDIINILKDLYIASGSDLDKTQNGIIIIDEFDKLGSIHNSDSGVRTTDVQQELLAILDGTSYNFLINNEDVSIDSSNITFVFSGACMELFNHSDVEKKVLGFNKELEPGKKENSSDVVITKKDIIKKIGFEEELMRRIPVLIQMNTLSIKDLESILTKSSISNLRIWQTALLEEDAIHLITTNEAINYIASKAYESGGGASGLQSIVSDTIEVITSDVLDGKLSDCDVIINKETVDNSSKYLVKKKEIKGENYELSEVDG